MKTEGLLLWAMLATIACFGLKKEFLKQGILLIKTDGLWL
jgi:hypothetical protein